MVKKLHILVVLVLTASHVSAQDYVEISEKELHGQELNTASPDTSIAKDRTATCYRWRDSQDDGEKRIASFGFCASMLSGHRDNTTELIGISYHYPLNAWIGVGGTVGAVIYDFTTPDDVRHKSVRPYIEPSVSLWTDYGIKFSNNVYITPTVDFGLIINAPFKAMARCEDSHEEYTRYNTSVVSPSIKAGIIFSIYYLRLQIGYHGSGFDIKRFYNRAEDTYSRRWTNGVYIGLRYDM